MFDLDFEGCLDKMLAQLSGDSVIDGNAKYLVGNRGEIARKAEEAKLEQNAKDIKL